jgi:hypothetical protein
MSNDDRRQLRRGERAARLYARLLRLYPAAHQQAFGEQMLRTFRDHYRDAVETEGEAEAHFWVRVVGDAGQSVVCEHLAALTERIWPMQTIFAAPFGVWRRRQTRRLALVTQLCLIAAVLLVWTPLLVGRGLLLTAEHGLMHSISDSVSYCINAAVKRPTNQFISAFTQATADIAAHELHAYHFSSSRVELSTFPVARAAVGASAGASGGASAGPTPPFLLDGEPAARLATDLRVVEGRLPMAAAGVLEVVVTQATADELHLALSAPLPITPIAGQQAPLVRVVGIVQTVGTVFPTNRVAFDPANQDMVWYWAQSNPLAYVLTSDEAIGTYAYDWAQVAPVEPFYSPPPPGTPLPPSEKPTLWQAWWIGTTAYAQMDARDLTAFVSHTAPDPSPRLNQLLDVPSLVQQTGFAPGATFAGFYEGNADDTDATFNAMLSAWILAALFAGVLVVLLWSVAGQLAERQQSLIAALRDRGDRGASRRRVIGALAVQAITPAALALLAGGLLAVLLARAVAAALLPGPARPVVDTLVGGPFDTGFGLAGGIAAVLLSLAAALVMLCAMRRATTPEPASGHHTASG